MKPYILIIGSGGHAGVVIDAIEECGKFQIIGLIDDFLQPNDIRHSYPIVGTINEASDFMKENDCKYYFIAIGKNRYRKQAFEKMSIGLVSPTIFHPSASVSKSAKIGNGCYIGANASVNRNCIIGDFSIVNTNASLDHDSQLGNFSSLNPNSAIGGNVKIGNDVTIGMSASIRNGISIGNNSFIKMGGIITEDVESNTKI